MVHNVPNFVFIIVMILTYLSYTYGPIWKDGPPAIPINTFHNCKNWILHYGFEEKDSYENKLMANERVKTHDPIAHVYAACYAYFISAFAASSLSNIDRLPEQYCEIVHNNNEIMPYESLQGKKMTCLKWITTYGYLNGQLDNDMNWHMAKNRVVDDDIYAHVWVAMFSKFVHISYPASILPYYFCDYIGQASPTMIDSPYVTLESLKSCEEWILMSNFTENGEYNLELAVRQDHTFQPYLSRSIVEYTQHLLEIHAKRSQIKCCESFLGPKPRSPESFCRHENLPHNIKIPYKY